MIAFDADSVFVVLNEKGDGPVLSDFVPNVEDDGFVDVFDEVNDPNGFGAVDDIGG